MSDSENNASPAKEEPVKESPIPENQLDAVSDTSEVKENGNHSDIDAGADKEEGDGDAPKKASEKSPKKVAVETVSPKKVAVETVSPKKGAVDTVSPKKGAVETGSGDAKSPKKAKKRKTEETEEAKKRKTEESEEAKKRKIKESEESEHDEEDEKSGEEKDTKVALLEGPIVLEAGRKRERKKVERMEIKVTVTPKDKKQEVPEGKGEKLGEIPRIEFKLGRTLADDLKPLHRVLFGRVGTAHEVKKNIRKFCGFSFEKDSPECDKKVVQINKFPTSMLKSFCDVLDTERGGTKDTIVNRILDFLLDPKSSGKPLQTSKRKRSSTGSKGSKRKRKPKGSKEDSKKKSKSPKKKAAKSKQEVEEGSGDEEEEEDKASAAEEEQSEEGSDASEVEDSADKSKADSEEEKSEDDDDKDDSDSDYGAPKKKRAKKEIPKKESPKKSPTKKTPAKKQDKKQDKPKEKKTEKKKETKKTPKKTPTPKKPAEKKVTKKKPAVVSSASDSDSSDDEPLVVKKKPPTDDELRDVIKKILDTANLEEITMKTVCKQVYGKYPDFDLTSRKEFIKTTVKQILR